MASSVTTEQFARDQYNLEQEVEKLKDEVQSWSQRFDVLMSDTFKDQVRDLVERAQ